MKMMLCVEIDVDITSTRRAEIKKAVERRLVELARMEKEPGQYLRNLADTGAFLVRAPEQPKTNP